MTSAGGDYAMLQLAKDCCVWSHDLLNPTLNFTIQRVADRKVWPCHVQGNLQNIEIKNLRIHVSRKPMTDSSGDLEQQCRVVPVFDE